MGKGAGKGRVGIKDAQAADAVALWRASYRELEERHEDLRSEHAALQERYARLHAGYRDALGRLYRARPGR